MTPTIAARTLRFVSVPWACLTATPPVADLPSHTAPLPATPPADCLGRIPGGDRFSHCRCWLDIERPCCHCGADDDGTAMPCKRTPDPARRSG